MYNKSLDKVKRLVARIMDLFFVSLAVNFIVPENIKITFIRITGILFIYFFITLLLFHKTFGDFIMHIELQSLRPRLLWYQILVRIILFPVGFIDLIFSLLNDKQLLHDEAAETVMVNKKNLNISDIILRIFAFLVVLNIIIFISLFIELLKVNM